MNKPILVSGIQPSGRLHVGNYLGALKHFVELQNSGRYECYFIIVDLHSLTEEFDPKKKRAQILELAADFISAGLDPKKSTIFLQSTIPAHSELAWILTTLTPIGELYRMTQFKDKSEHQKQNVNAGLLTYPTLMAADILLYDPKYIPVGEDQMQHVELTRTLTRKFNSKFGHTFIEPHVLLTEAPRVMSLGDPTKKMSKSRPETCLFVDDSPVTIELKLRRAVTDSEAIVRYDKERKPAISNLLTIYSALSGEKIAHLERRYAGKPYSEFKMDLARIVTAHFTHFRAKKKDLLAHPKKLKDILAAGTRRAEKRAVRKMKEVKQKVGIAL